MALACIHTLPHMGKEIAVIKKNANVPADILIKMLHGDMTVGKNDTSSVIALIRSYTIMTLLKQTYHSGLLC
jgi:hypothetical protein